LKKSAARPADRAARSRRRRRRYTRRYELTIPRRDNQGTEFHPERINTVYDELNGISGGYTRYPVAGGWQGGPQEHHYVFQVDVPDVPKSRMFFTIYRALLEARFAQAEIYVRSYRVAAVKRFSLSTR
jgi:hypothetical protein